MVAVARLTSRPRRYARGRHRITRGEYDDYATLYRRGLSKTMIARWRWVSPHRVERALAAYGVPTRPPRLNVSYIARIMGVADYTVERWIAEGHLKVAEPKRWKRQGQLILIYAHDLVDFLRVRDAWPTYETATITDQTYRRYAERLREAANGRWVSIPEIAATLKKSPITVRGWREAGWPKGWRWLSLTIGHFLWLPTGKQLPPQPVGYYQPNPKELATRSKATWQRELREAYDEVAAILRDDGFELTRIAAVLGVSTWQQVQEMIARHRKKHVQMPHQAARNVAECPPVPFSSPGTSPQPPAPPRRAVGPQKHPTSAHKSPTASPPAQLTPQALQVAQEAPPSPAIPDMPPGSIESLAALYGYFEVEPPDHLVEQRVFALPLADDIGVTLWLSVEEHYHLTAAGVLLRISLDGTAQRVRGVACPSALLDLVQCLREDYEDDQRQQAARGAADSTHDVGATLRFVRDARGRLPRRWWRKPELQLV